MSSVIRPIYKRISASQVLFKSKSLVKVPQQLYSFCTTIPDLKESVSVTFLKPGGKRIAVKASEDKSLYDAVIDNNVDIDGFGACEGTLCCTTCHSIFKQSDYEKVGGPSDEELDMLDLAYGLTGTSRLSCQIMLKKELDPLEVEVPMSINDIRES